jgi:hypothetical protein
MSKSACWFEIPTKVLLRAKTFYEAIFEMSMRKMSIDNDLMYVFPSDEGMVSGALFQAQDFNPRQDGIRLYFDGNPDLDVFLDRIESAGGRVLKPKTLITKEIGYYADFRDTEGNAVSLYSQE